VVDSIADVLGDNMKYSKIALILAVLLSGCLFSPILSDQDETNDSVATGVLNTAPIWTFRTTDRITSSPVGDDKGQVYIRTLNSVIALDALSGLQLWSAESPSNFPLSIKPYVFGEYLLVPEKDSRVATFSTATGQLIWRSPLIDTVLTHPTAIEIEAISFSESLVYVARFDWSLIAYRLTDGEKIWEANTAGRANPYLASDKKTVYLGLGSLLKAYDSKTGTLLWQQDIDGYIGPMRINGNVLYVSDEANPSLLAIDLSTREVLWRKYYNQINEFEIGCISLINDAIYIGAEELIAIYQNDGTVIWSSPKLGRLECPVNLGDYLFVRNTGTTLFAFKRETGQKVGELRVEENTTMKHEPDRGPAVVYELLLVPTNNNLVAAYRP